MSSSSEAKDILRLVASGVFKMAEHAYGRSIERSISRAQIIHCARHCLHHSWQESHGTYLFVGYLDSSSTGGFSAVLKDGVVIVTVFRRRLTKWEKRRVRGRSIKR